METKQTWKVVQVAGFAPTNGMTMASGLGKRKAQNLAERMSRQARETGSLDVYSARME